MAFSEPGFADKKIAMESIQIVAKIAESKNHIARTLYPLVDPKKTVTPDKIVRIETVASKITINCTKTSFSSL
jgi:hypothetical protein